jgi:hypothetical protein
MYFKHATQWPLSPEDKTGILISLLPFFLNTTVILLSNRVPEEHNAEYMYIKCFLYSAHMMLIPLSGFHDLEQPWKTFSMQYLLYTCCLLPFSAMFYLGAHYGPSMDRIRSFYREHVSNLIKIGIIRIEQPVEAQAPRKKPEQPQPLVHDILWPFSREESVTVILIWLGLSAVFITSLLVHPVPPPDLDSLEDVLPLARFLLARFFSPFVKPDVSSWTWNSRVLVNFMDRLDLMLNVYWKMAVVASLAFVAVGPDALSTEFTPPAPTEDDKEEYDINKEQWVIGLRAKASAEDATRRVLQAAKEQIAWYSAAYDAQKLQLNDQANTMDVQQKSMRTVVATRERQSQTLASVKTQLAALEKKDKASTKLQAQFIGEKQHLLDALTNSQHAVQGAKGTLRLRDLELDTLKSQLASYKVQQSIAADQKSFASKLEAYNTRRLEDAFTQIKTMKEQLESSESISTIRLKYAKNLNDRLDVVSKAMQQADMPCNPWYISQEDLVAKLTLAKYSDVQQEAKLAESCAELSAANETLKRDLSASESKLAETSASLETSKSETQTAQTSLQAAQDSHHAAFQNWQKELCNAAHALSAAKQAHPSLPLKDQIATLQTKLKTAQDDTKNSRDLLAHHKHKAAEFSHLLTEQMQKTKSARECLDRCVRINCELRETLVVRDARVKDLEKRGEAADEDRHFHRKEIQRLSGLLEGQEKAVVALERTNEKLEKELVLGEEFDKITGWDLPLPFEVERERQEEEDGVVVWEEDAQEEGAEECEEEFGEDFVEGFEESFEEVDVEDAVEDGSEKW